MKDPQITQITRIMVSRRGAPPSGKGNPGPAKDRFWRFDVIGAKTKSA
jgi:hypothetical protein